MKMFVTPEEFRILRKMKEEKFEEVYLWCSICSEFLAATPTERKKVAASLIQRYSGKGLRGMSLKSIYRKANIYIAKRDGRDLYGKKKISSLFYFLRKRI